MKTTIHIGRRHIDYKERNFFFGYNRTLNLIAKIVNFICLGDVYKEIKSSILQNNSSFFYTIILFPPELKTVTVLYQFREAKIFFLEGIDYLLIFYITLFMNEIDFFFF